jgi:hypothetical protein
MLIQAMRSKGGSMQTRPNEQSSNLEPRSRWAKVWATLRKMRSDECGQPTACIANTLYYIDFSSGLISEKRDFCC